MTDYASLLTTAQAAALYEEERRKLLIEHPEISPKTLRIHNERGNIKGVMLGNRLFFERKEVKRFAKANRGPGNPKWGAEDGATRTYKRKKYKSLAEYEAAERERLHAEALRAKQ